MAQSPGADGFETEERMPRRAIPLGLVVLFGAVCCRLISAQTTGEFIITGNMLVNRLGGYSTTLLQDGRVLIAGGADQFQALASAEIFDPVTQTFTATGSMNAARVGHTATLLPDGRVLMAGGLGADAYVALDADMLTTAELYDPATGTFSSTGSLPVVYYFGISATLLQDGRVLVAGGISVVYGEGTVMLPGVVGGVATIYDPDAGRFTSAGRIPMVNPVAAPLQDGRVLLVGVNPTLTDNVALLFDPGANAFTPVSASPHSIFSNQVANAGTTGFAAAPLADGNVLLVGGRDTKGPYLASRATGEIFDVRTETFSATGRLPIPFDSPTAVSLAGGRVLVGMYGTSALYDPQSETFSDLGLPGLNGRSTVLLDGTVFITGAYKQAGATWVYVPLPEALSSASSTTPVAPESLVSVYGSGFAQSIEGAHPEAPPLALAGATATVYDSTHTPRLAPLLYVSPSQINFQVPAGTAPGAATLLLTNSLFPGGARYLTVPVNVAGVAPGLFTRPGDFAGVAGRGVNADGSVSVSNQNLVYTVLYGTGIRGGSSVVVTVGGVAATITYAGPEGTTAGLDFVEIILPPALNERGIVPLKLTVDGVAAKQVYLRVVP